VLFEEASSFVIENQSNPFFLYLATTKPHTPYDVHGDFRNSGPLSTYGDVIREIDFRVGEFLQLLDNLELTDHTMIIFSSDNGGVSSLNGYFRDLGIDHNTNDPLRGNKGDVWDGGVRIPFVLRYPDLVKPGTTSDVPFCATDLMASFADLLNLEIPSSAGEDSYNVLPALLGTGQISAHPFVLQGRAGTLGLCWGQWKYIPDPGNGDHDAESKLIPPDALPGQFYRITTDTGEQHNLYLRFPEKVKMMDETLNRIVEGTGRDVYKSLY
jgi:arylsulfatase A